MPVDERHWREWLERLYNLRRDRRGAHERPHKPVLLLSILELTDRGFLTQNRIELTEDLVKTFRRIFEVVRSGDDQPSIHNPLFHLSGDGFWRLVPRPGEGALYRSGEAGGSPSLAELRRRVEFASLDPGLWALMWSPETRQQLRQALVSRYFPQHWQELNDGAHVLALREDSAPVLPPGRSAAFRKVVLEIYDYTCAACGVRLVVGGEDSLVEAAHLVPFSESRSDNPRNGVALCPNHHWAMDRFLIAPCPSENHPAGIWKVSGRLDTRLHGQKELVELSGMRVIGPKEEKFIPDREGLRWRCEKLLAA